MSGAGEARPARGSRAEAPRDIPLPSTLRAFPGHELEPRGDYDALGFASLDFAGQKADDATFLGCRVERCVLDGVSMRRAHVAECRIDELAAASLDAADSVWRDALITVRRVGALLATGASLTSVRMRGGRLDLVDLSGAKLATVAFEGCAIGELDLGTVEARDLTLEGCEIELLDLTGAHLVRADFTGAAVGSVRGIAGLRGATITSGQLIGLAPLMADQLGIKIREG